MDISLIIVTRNRAEDLRQTLSAVAGVAVPEGQSAELLVVDNNSTDHTHAVVESAELPGFEVRYLHEPATGKSRGLNLALREARGRVLVFTDDDVRPEPEWLATLIAPIQSGEADAVQGTIRLADHLRRPWMSGRVLSSLADHTPCAGKRIWLVGANCAVGRHVLFRVSRFDERIGPPITGGGEDTLFSEQVEDAGFRILAVPGAVVHHYPQASRITRKSILYSARLGGRSDAYLAHHWHHQAFDRVHLRWVRSIARLWYHRATRFAEILQKRVPGWELEDVKNISRWQAYLVERRLAPSWPRTPGTVNDSAVEVAGASQAVAEHAHG